MVCFNDANNRSWQIHLNVATCQTLKAGTGLNLANAQDVANVAALGNDPAKLGEVLWHLVAEQGAAVGVTKDDFFASLDGDALEAGFDALAGAYVAFMPSGVRGSIRNALDETQRRVELAAKAIQEAVASPKYRDQVVSDAFAELFSDN
jgi:hypothetical protein